MKRFFVALMVVSLAAAAMATDPGVPDTVIYEQNVVVPYNPGNWSRAWVSVYVVTDDSVGDATLPTKWISPDDQIYPDTIVWLDAFAGWDETWYAIRPERRMISVLCWSDLGGPDNPILHTNLQRVLAFKIGFRISPTASQQVVVIDTTQDPFAGPPNFGLARGSGSFTPVIVPGSIHYGTTGINDEMGQLPSGFTLQQNYPNPFNATTQIQFSIPTSAEVSLEVFNLLGQKVKTLVLGSLSAGAYSVSWDGTDDSGAAVPSGAYFYRLTSAGMTDTKTMMLLK